MLCREIIKVLETTYPTEAALSFDNVGLLMGSACQEVNCVYVALDASTPVIEDAIKVKADLLITHHPLIFSPVKNLVQEDFIGRRIRSLIQSDIACYTIHTNYDVFSMAKLSGNLLGLQDSDVLDVTYERDNVSYGIGQIGSLESEMTLAQCATYVKERLGVRTVKVFGDLEKKIKNMALLPGSGKSAIPSSIRKGADVLVAGDIGHHEGLDATEQGLAIIDPGHYGTEYIFMEDIQKFFEKSFPLIEIKTAPIVRPFSIV